MRHEPDRSGCAVMSVLLLLAILLVGPGMILWGLDGLRQPARCGSRPMNPAAVCHITQDGTDGWVSSFSREEKPGAVEDAQEVRTYQQMVDEQRSSAHLRIGVGVACLVIEAVVLIALTCSGIRRRSRDDRQPGR